MKRLWHAFLEWLRRKGVLAREGIYLTEGEDVAALGKRRRYNRHRCLFPSAARQMREARAKAGLSLRQVARLWGRRHPLTDGRRFGANSKYVADCERGHLAPTVGEFAKLRAAV